MALITQQQFANTSEIMLTRPFVTYLYVGGQINAVVSAFPWYDVVPSEGLGAIEITDQTDVRCV